MSQNVSKEIEDEANSYFQRIYNHPPHPTLSIDEVLEMLSKFKESQSKRERVRGYRSSYSYLEILFIWFIINSDTDTDFCRINSRFWYQFGPLVGRLHSSKRLPGKSQLKMFNYFVPNFRVNCHKYYFALILLNFILLSGKNVRSM